MSTIFVGGVHGVGKTTVCKAVADATGYTHVTASQLIREKNSAAIAKNTKQVENPEYNQQLFVQAVKERQNSGQRLVIDGHFTLQTASGIQRIDPKVYEGIAPAMIAVLCGDPSTIVERIKQRDNKEISTDEVSGQQIIEVEHAKEIAKRLQIPYIEICSGDQAVEKMIMSLQSIMS